MDQTGIPDINQIPDEYFQKIRAEMAKQQNPGKALTPEQEKQMADGFAIEEMSRTAGWQVIKEVLEGMAFHSWVDPRTVEPGAGSSRDEWMWRELNAFYMANNAKELLEMVNTMISTAHGLQRVKLGETRTTQKMRL